MAIEFALDFSKKNSSLSSRGLDETKTIRDATTVKTENDANAFYVINYNEGGFVIFAADDRVSPILAYSDDGYFSTNIQDMPDSVLAWIEQEKELIQFVKTEGIVQNPETKLEWDYTLNRIPDPFDASCNDIFIEKGPLTSTIWSQVSSFNNLIPLNCPNSFSGKAPVGCVAVAMAQIMKYHNKPLNYNWSNMPNNVGTIDTQTLMRDIGTAVSMDYGCDGSGANTQANVAFAFAGGFGNPGYFGYSNATYTPNYSSSLIKQQIDWNKPVIIRGGRKKNGISWNMYTGGHAWVCDGYRSFLIRERDENGNCTGLSWGYTFLRMNWGSYNGDYNGWYNDQNFNLGTSTYNYKRGIVYNINP